MTNHFNQLSEAEQERLVILIEECNEVAQIGCKILRHGYESHNPYDSTKETNRQALQRELRDLFHALLRMENNLDVPEISVSEADGLHKAKYLHHND